MHPAASKISWGTNILTARWSFWHFGSPLSVDLRALVLLLFYCICILYFSLLRRPNTVTVNFYTNIFQTPFILQNKAVLLLCLICKYTLLYCFASFEKQSWIKYSITSAWNCLIRLTFINVLDFIISQKHFVQIWLQPYFLTDDMTFPYSK